MLDFRRRTVTRASAAPPNHAAIVKIREGVLADAIEKNVVAFAHISMRLRIDLAPGGVQTDFLFWGLLSLHELGYFPLHKMATPRAGRVLWRRRAEVWGFLLSMFSFRSVDEKVRATLASRHSGTTTEFVMADEELGREADHIHRALFGRAAQGDLQRQYVSAMKDAPLAGALPPALDKLMEAGVDLEALELALRRRQPRNALTQRFQVLCYLAEVQPANYGHFVTERRRFLVGSLTLGLHVVRSIYKLVKDSGCSNS